MALIDDWLAYVEEPDRFDQDHFASLMLELDTPALLHRALDPLSNGAAVADRIAGFRERADFNGTYLLPPMRDGDIAVARQLAERYRDVVADRLREIGDAEATLVRDSPIQLFTYEDYRELRRNYASSSPSPSSLQLLEVVITLQDDEDDATRQFPEWKYGLREAVYMMTTFPEITRHLLWPMFKYPLDDTPAAELWLMGHRVDFCRDRTLLIVGGAG